MSVLINVRERHRDVYIVYIDTLDTRVQELNSAFNILLSTEMSAYTINLYNEYMTQVRRKRHAISIIINGNEIHCSGIYYRSERNENIHRT